MKLRLKDFVAFCAGTSAEGLVYPVVKQLGGWDEAQDELWNVSRCPAGAAGGFTGFIYYSETSEFAKQHLAAIKDSIKRIANELGEGIIETVKGFNCIGDDYSLDEIGEALYGKFDEKHTYIYNALAWYALEEVAYRFDEWSNEQIKDEED